MVAKWQGMVDIIPNSPRTPADPRRDLGVAVSVNVCWRERISPEQLVACVREPDRWPDWGLHLDRFLSELPAAMSLGFFDRHGITRAEARAALAHCRARYGTRNPELEGWTDEGR